VSWSDLSPFVTALAIGLLIGFEREWSHREGHRQAAGSRTFAVLAVAGAVAAAIDPWVVAGGFVAVGAVIAVGYSRTTKDDPGATTEIAALATYLLGALAYDRTELAVAIAVVIAALLYSKERLHRLARQVITEVEVEDAIKFLVIAFVILPLLPDQDLGPYGVLNPQSVWKIVVLLTGVGWVGYIGVRALGPRRGLLITGLAGGFVSASATTASMGRLSRSMDGVRAPLGGALLASIATMVQLIVVVWFVDSEVVRRLWPAAVAGGLTLSAVALILYRGARVKPTEGQVVETQQDEVDTGRPFAIKPALVLAAILTVALLVARWGAATFGAKGAVIAGAFAGLADAHAGAIASAQLANKGDISVSTALLATAAALGANTVTKSVLAFATGGRRFGTRFVIGVLPAAIVFGVVIVITAQLE